MQLFKTALVTFLAGIVIAAPAPAEAQSDSTITTSFQPYNASDDSLVGLEKRAWQGCSTGPQISTGDVDNIRNWLWSNGGTINVLPGTWLRRESGGARLCILNNDKSVKTFDNWEQGWVDDYIAHGINCCATSNCYGGWAYLKDTTGTKRKAFLQSTSTDCYVAH